jgi:hypothetical protein
MSSAADRQREYRHRLRDGKKVYPLTLDECQAEFLLQSAGLIGPDPSHADVVAGLERFFQLAHDEAAAAL